MMYFFKVSFHQLRGVLLPLQGFAPKQANSCKRRRVLALDLMSQTELDPSPIQMVRYKYATKKWEL